MKSMPMNTEYREYQKKELKRNAIERQIKETLQKHIQELWSMRIVKNYDLMIIDLTNLVLNKESGE